MFVAGDTGDAVLLPHFAQESGTVSLAVEDEQEATSPGMLL
jgi:hypothetical protein